MPGSASYNDLLMSIIQDDARAVGYLNAALEDSDPRVFLLALRDVAQAQGGIGKIAQRSGLNRESLYRTLSETGNPSVQTLASVLRALGARLEVGRVGHETRLARVAGPLGSFSLTGNVRPISCWRGSPSRPAEQLAAA